MSNWQSTVVDLGEVRLHITRTGGDKPPLVLAHGVTDDGLCWTPVARAFEAERDVIMVDARGHGRSTAPEHGYDPLTQGRDLAGVITALGLNKPPVLGHSMGAASTLGLAAQRPDLPGAILLEDPPSWWQTPKADDPATAERLRGMRQWLEGLKAQTREALIAQERINSPRWSDDELGPWADSKLRVSQNVTRIFEERFLETLGWPGALKVVTCPALLIKADPTLGAIVTDEAAAELVATIPHLAVVTIAGAGHSIHRDAFADYVAAVRAFLARAGV